MKMSEEQFQVFLDSITENQLQADRLGSIQVVITRRVGKHERTRLLTVPIILGDLYDDTALALGWDPSDEKVDDSLLYLSKRNVIFIKRVEDE